MDPVLRIRTMWRDGFKWHTINKQKYHKWASYCSRVRAIRVYHLCGEAVGEDMEKGRKSASPPLRVYHLGRESKQQTIHNNMSANNMTTGSYGCVFRRGFPCDWLHCVSFFFLRLLTRLCANPLSFFWPLKLSPVPVLVFCVLVLWCCSQR